MAKEKIPTFKAGDRFVTISGRRGVVLGKSAWYSPYSANQMKGYRVRFDGAQEEEHVRLQYFARKLEQEAQVS